MYIYIYITIYCEQIKNEYEFYTFRIFLPAFNFYFNLIRKLWKMKSVNSYIDINCKIKFLCNFLQSSIFYILIPFQWSRQFL